MAWGLEQTRYFMQGCDNLVVVTDHKPLTKIFGNHTLDQISNSRLFGLFHARMRQSGRRYQKKLNYKKQKKDTC